ncbi:MAG: hypothetical protein LRZ97_01780 [Candidatus Pacebacteria bacterium]|nr:hypothetical protein [Candidatus Paceibacterota bacterium]
MQHIIDKLQKKSDAQKAFYALTISVLVTALLFSVWGYNFAHSGNINNIASGAASVVQKVDEANINENFNKALEQFKQLNNQVIDTVQSPNDAQVDSGAGARHMNVFENPANTQQITEEEYGENPADVLY